MKKHLLATGLAAALAVGGAVAAAAAQADPPPASADKGPVTKGAGWLAGQVPESGLFHISSEFGGVVYESDDVGLTIDGVRALEATGGHPTEVAAMTTAVAGAMPGYYSSFGTTYANGAAKAASFLLEHDVAGTPTTTALADLQSTISDTAPIAGRIEDQNNSFGDNGSPLGQAFAVQALAEAAAPELAGAQAFLLSQQCEAGFLRASFASDKTATDQTCDGAATGEGGASVDTTAFTILALQDLAATDETVAAALDAAASWLATVQGADGSFTTAGAAGAGNANSTGLAGWALGAEGDSGSAADAALWLRAHQLNNAAACRPFATADDGALVVDDLGVTNARSGALDDIDRSVALRATAQALPALAWAPGGPSGAGQTDLVFTAEYVRAGTTQAVAVRTAPGNTLCVRTGTDAVRTVVVPASGTTTIAVKLPPTTGRTSVLVADASGEVDRATVAALAARKLPVKAMTKTVRQGNKSLVTVSGLSPAEPVKVLYRGKTVLTGQASAKGTFSKRVTATGKPGKAKIVAVGRFTDRRGSTMVTVVR